MKAIADLMNDWELDGNKNRWVPPSDRHLALLAKLKVGWSYRTQRSPASTTVSGGEILTGPVSNTLSTQALSEDELAHIKFTLAKADRMERQEQERVGRLVDRVDRMKRMAIGDGVNDCLVCGVEFGMFGTRTHAAQCQDCRKYVCHKTCGLDIFSDGDRRSIFICRICNEERETWKKSGAWFYHGVPKHVLPPGRRDDYDVENGVERSSSAGPSSSKVAISPNRNISGRESDYQARQRPQNGAARRLPLAPDDDDDGDLAPSIPQPRWALADAGGRRHWDASPRAGRAPSADRCSSSSDDEQQDHGRGRGSRWEEQGRQLTNQSSGSYSDERSDNDRGEGSDRSSAGTRTSPISSRRSPASNLDNATMDGSDGRSVDSGVVRGEQSPINYQISTALPSSPSEVLSNSTKVARLPMQPITPTFRFNHVDTDQQNIGSAAAASRRASVAAVERLVEKLSLTADDSGKPFGGRMDHRLSLTCASEVAVALRPLTPDVPSSPEDDESSMGTLEFVLLYDAEEQTLKITIIKAKNLRSMDKNGFSDPYVKTYLLPGAGKSTKLRTKTIQKTLNPEWNENLVYYGISDEERLKKTLRLLVLDEDRIGADFLGETRVPLKRLVPGKEKTFSVYLERQLPVEKSDSQPECRGKILMSLMYDNDKKCLVVEIIRCAELVGMDPNGYSDPYVKICLGPESDKKQQAKTKIKKKTLNPAFDEKFLLPVSLADLQKKTLDITVWDRDVGKHDDYIGSVQLGLEAKGDRLKHWYDCMKNPGTTFQKWHKLSAEQLPHTTASSSTS